MDLCVCPKLLEVGRGVKDKINSLLYSKPAELQKVVFYFKICREFQTQAEGQSYQRQSQQTIATSRIWEEAITSTGGGWCCVVRAGSEDKIFRLCPDRGHPELTTHSAMCAQSSPHSMVPIEYQSIVSTLS